ncbi:MAG: tryptophan--tRNA ligase [Pseudomonadales bacterium]|nr:tryptophan--tRNA ligase [Pseudomonadales bacterium]
MTATRYLTGITTTGTPHLGNYVGAIRPAIEASKNDDFESFYFLADYHALVKCHDPAMIQQSTREIAATWMALGLDTDKAVFYRQSDIREIPELCWILTCMAAKGLMNRAHAYKAAVQENIATGDSDPDKGITMGLFSYPVLMAADILMFQGQKIPVGKDQIQHIEMARDIAARFNHHFGETFVLPEAVVSEDVKVLSGLDGRKMSKSYGNTIPLFQTSKKMQKSLNKIKTNLLEPGEAKDPNDSTVFEVWQAFADQDQRDYMRQQFAQGIAWGQAKKELHALIEAQLGAARDRYFELLENIDQVEQVLQAGATKARQHAQPLMQQVRQAVGLSSLQQD